MNKKIPTLLTLGTGFILGYVGVQIIDYACKKPAQTKGLRENSKKYLPWIAKQEFIELETLSFDGLKLKAKLLKAENEESDKVIIAIHGYHSYNMREYAYYIKFYHDLGFHILLPDNRAHGLSEGKFIGFGWLDRLDCIRWITKTKKYFNKDLQIALHGISMGSATVLMASGEELDDDVKCIISDCGFSDVIEEFKYKLKLSHVPYRSILFISNLLSRLRVGYTFKDASTINQVKKSKTPTLFIHGDQDDFVPTYMVYDLYNACSAEKDLFIVEGAGHAQSYVKNPKLWEDTVTNFMKQYIKL